MNEHKKTDPLTPRDILLDTIQAIRDHSPISEREKIEPLSESFVKFLRGMVRGLIVATYDACYGSEFVVGEVSRKHETHELTARSVCDEAEAVIRDLWPPMGDGGEGEFFSRPIFTGSGEAYFVHGVNKLHGQIREALKTMGDLQQPPMSTEEVSSEEEFRRHQIRQRHLRLIRSIIVALDGESLLKPQLTTWLTVFDTPEARIEATNKLEICGAMVEASDGTAIRWSGNSQLPTIVASWYGVLRTEPYTTPEFSIF